MVARGLNLILFACVLVCSLASANVVADEASDQYAVAAGHYDQERWQFAVDEFRKFLRDHPRHARVDDSIFFLGESLSQTGRLDSASAQFAEYLKRSSKGQFARPALFRFGEAAHLTGKPNIAAANLEKFQRYYPADSLNAYVFLYLGEIALARDEYAKAESFFRRGLDKFPNDHVEDDYRVGLGRALENQGQVGEAEKLYAAVLAKSGSELAGVARFHLGALMYSVARYEEAVRTLSEFDKLPRESPCRAKAKMTAGWALIKLGRDDEARELFSRIASDEAIGFEARYWLALTQKSAQEWASAARTLSNLLSENPDHKLILAIRFHSGDALLRLGKTAEAKKHFQLVLANGSDQDQWFDDAVCGMIQADLIEKNFKLVEAGTAGFLASFTESDLRADIEQIQARSYLEQGRPKASAKIMKRLVDANREGRALEDRYLLALAYSRLGQVDEALSLLDDLLRKAGRKLNPEVLLTQSSILVEAKRYGEAIDSLERFLAFDLETDADQKAKAQLAVCYAHTEQIGKAKVAFQKFERSKPTQRLRLSTVEQLAEAAYRAGDMSWSSVLFRELGSEAGEKRGLQRGLAGLGWSQFNAGNLTAAEKTFQRLLDTEPGGTLGAETAMVLAKIREKTTGADAVLAMLEMVIKKYEGTSQHPKAILAAARIRRSLHQGEQARLLYEKLVRLYPKLPEMDTVLYEWGWGLFDLRREKESVEKFERIHEEFPESRYWTDVSYRLARLAFDAKDYQRADQLLEEVLKADPPKEISEYALYLRGQVAVAKNRWDEVKSTMDLLLEIKPENQFRVMAEYWIAESLYRQGKYEEAGRLFEKLSQSDFGLEQEWLAMVPLRRAQLLTKKKRWNEAYEIASSIEKQYPNFGQQYEVDYLIGRSLASRAEFEAARRSYRKVVRSPSGGKTETAAMAQWMIGETFLHQKNHATALREFLRVEILYSYPRWQAAALLQAGKCYEELGKWKQAAKLYSRVVRNYGKEAFAEEAGRRLKGLRRRGLMTAPVDLAKKRRVTK